MEQKDETLVAVRRKDPLALQSSGGPCAQLALPEVAAEIRRKLKEGGQAQPITKEASEPAGTIHTPTRARLDAFQPLCHQRRSRFSPVFPAR